MLENRTYPEKNHSVWAGKSKTETIGPRIVGEQTNEKGFYKGPREDTYITPGDIEKEVAQRDRKRNLELEKKVTVLEEEQRQKEAQLKLTLDLLTIMLPEEQKHQKVLDTMDQIKFDKENPEKSEALFRALINLCPAIGISLPLKTGVNLEEADKTLGKLFDDGIKEILDDTKRRGGMNIEHTVSSKVTAITNNIFRPLGEIEEGNVEEKQFIIRVRLTLQRLLEAKANWAYNRSLKNLPPHSLS